MRFYPAALLLPAVLAIGCSSAKNNTVPAASAPAAPVAAVSTGAPSAPDAVPSVTVTGSGAVPRATRPAPTPAATAAPKDETDLARQMLITLNDFPAGYTEKPSTAQSSPLDKLCTAPKAAGETGKAETGDFTENNGNTSVSESLAVYDSPEHADAAFSTSITAGDCIVKAVNAGKLDDSKAAYSQATFTPVSFPRVGDRSNAYRLQFHAKVKGQTGFGSEVDGFFDLVYVREGRSAYAIIAEDILTPFDSTLLQQIVGNADAAARRGLGLPAGTPAPQ